MTTNVPARCAAHAPTHIVVPYGPVESMDLAALDRMLCPRRVPVRYRVGRDDGGYNRVPLGVGMVAGAADLFTRCNPPAVFAVEAFTYPAEGGRHLVDVALWREDGTRFGVWTLLSV